jgi:hypothetical protein
MAAKRTWLWVILGIFGTIVLFVVVLIGGAIYMFRTHVKAEYTASPVAEQEFTRQRERFRGQQPLVEVTEGKNDRDDVPTVHRPPSDARRVAVHTLRVLIYDVNEGRLIHADIPGWVLRLMPEGRSNVYSGDYGSFDMRRNRITIEDLERHGLGLVMDQHNRNTRILVWSE